MQRLGTVSDTVAVKREFVVDAVAGVAHMTAGSETEQERLREAVHLLKRQLEERGQ